MKINGRIEPVGEEKVFPAEMDNYIREIYAISGNRDMTRIQEQGDDDFSFSIVGAVPVPRKCDEAERFSGSRHPNCTV